MGRPRERGSGEGDGSKRTRRQANDEDRDLDDIIECKRSEMVAMRHEVPNLREAPHHRRTSQNDDEEMADTPALDLLARAAELHSECINGRAWCASTPSRRPPRCTSSSTTP